MKLYTGFYKRTYPRKRDEEKRTTDRWIDTKQQRLKTVLLHPHNLRAHSNLTGLLSLTDDIEIEDPELEILDGFKINKFIKTKLSMT
jgi:hypothetical protein